MGRGWKRIALDADTAQVPNPTTSLQGAEHDYSALERASASGGLEILFNLFQRISFGLREK
jgi:hypothetical protein